MNTKVNALIDSRKEEYAAMLTRWIRIPSVKAAPADGAPFGSEVRRMLDTAVADTKAMGFAVRSFDGYACDITLGSEELEKVAVLGHLDVVPAGDGWNVDPFEAVRKGDLIYGRGTSDDKGPALAALLAMKAIQDAGIPLKRAVRLILGCDEESGWEDMDYYCAHAQMPELGFSPDASFPLINLEKGMVHMMCSAPLSKDGLQVKQLHTGERFNVIPGESVAVLEGGAELAAQVAAFAEKTGMDYKAEVTADGVRVTATGIPGHAAYPEGRRNAIGMMLILLRELGVTGALRALADVYPMEYDGKALGIACSDEKSGSLTCNMGILHVENGQFHASFDCRCPLCAAPADVRDTIMAHLPGFSFSQVSLTQSHYVPEDSELVTCLLDAYHEETGLPAKAAFTGGGTYAKVMKQGVAFGASFPDDADLAHQAGEFIDINKMILSAKIYANALLRLCAE